MGIESSPEFSPFIRSAEHAVETETSHVEQADAQTLAHSDDEAVELSCENGSRQPIVQPPSALQQKSSHSEQRIPSQRARQRPRHIRRNTNDSVALYFEEVGKYDLLHDLEEEQELARQIKKGREAAAQLETEVISKHEREQLEQEVARAKSAKDHFINANLRLVSHIAKKYPVPPGQSILDLIQSGNIGLVRAVDKYDGELGFRFSTYATFWIKQAIERELEQAPIITIPGKRVSDLRRTVRDVGGDLSLLSDDEQIVYKMIHPDSLNRVLGDSDDDQELIDFLPHDVTTEDEVMYDLNRATLKELLGSLPIELSEVLTLRFDLDNDCTVAHTYEEIAEKLGITKDLARRRVMYGFRDLKLQLDNRGNL